MKTLKVQEAAPGLDRLAEPALASEQIQIRQVNRVVELQPAHPVLPADEGQLAPLEALRRLQEEGKLTPQRAEEYLHEIHEERLADERQRPAFFLSTRIA